jgi:hypothetical protein
MPKKGNFERKSSLTILLSSLGLHLSSRFVKCVKDVACKSSHINFYKTMSDLICTCSMYFACDMYLCCHFTK